MSAPRLHRSFALVLACLLGASLLGACGEGRDDGKETLKKAIERTLRESRAFVYEEVLTGGKRTTVAGLVEDDYRYQAELRVDEQPMHEEAGSDDALAMRALRPDAVPTLLGDAASGAGANPIGATSPSEQAKLRTSIDALRQGKWVVDPVGAPSLVLSPDDRRKAGDDPVFDAMTLLTYTERAVDSALFAARFNPDAIDPVFKADEERMLNFPRPETGAETERWDLRPPPVPKPNSLSSTGAQLVPTVVNFRFMSIYIRNGLVVQVREVIDIQSKLEDLIRDYKLPPNTTSAQAIEALNRVRTGQGAAEVIRPRRMVFDLKDLGGPNKVAMPGDAVQGTLAMVKYRGKAARVGVAPPAGS